MGKREEKSARGRVDQYFEILLYPSSDYVLRIKWFSWWDAGGNSRRQRKTQVVSSNEHVVCQKYRHTSRPDRGGRGPWH